MKIYSAIDNLVLDGKVHNKDQEIISNIEGKRKETMINNGWIVEKDENAPKVEAKAKEMEAPENKMEKKADAETKTDGKGSELLKKRGKK